MPDKFKRMLWPHKLSAPVKLNFPRPFFVCFFLLLKDDRFLSRGAAYFIQGHANLGYGR